MKADPVGLAALAARLAAAASSTAAKIPTGVTHPPLAADTVSAGAAGRLSAAGGILSANAAGQVTDLDGLAARLSAVAGVFSAQEAANAAAQSTLAGSPALSGAKQLPPPLVRPPVAPDVRPPLVPAPPPGGEAVATQYAAGSAEAGQGFAQGWKSAAQAFRDAARELRDSAAALPEVWRSTAPGAVLAAVFTSRAETFDGLATQAERLSQQGGAHAQGFQTAVNSAPTPAEFATNRTNLQTAQLNNARTGGLYSAQVATLTAERARLEQRAAMAHTTYFTHSAEATEGSPGPGETPEGGGEAEKPGDPSAPGDATEAGIDPATGLPEDALLAEAGALDDPMMAQMMPMLLSTLVGGLGGVMGSLVQPLSSLPQQVLSAGAGAMQSATSALGSAGDRGAPELPEIGAAELPELGGLGGGGGAAGGATTPAAGVESLAPVSGAGPMTAPGGAPVASAGSVPTTATTGDSSGMRGGMVPPMAPIGGGVGGGGQDKDNKRETRIALPDRANSEPISGEIQERVEAVAGDGTERVPPPKPSGAKVYRITDPERE